jgi:hypothetical protein
MAIEIQRRRNETNSAALLTKTGEAPRISTDDALPGTGARTFAERQQPKNELLAAPNCRDEFFITRIGAGARDNIEAVARGESDRETVRDLLLLLDTINAGGEPITFQIGNDELTPAQLLLQLERDPNDFDDYLRANDLSLRTLSLIADDVAMAGPQPGAAFDLRAGSELVRFYREGNERPTRAKAIAEPDLSKQLTIEDKTVEEPSFFEMVGEALAEAAAAIARLFGSSWSPDTVTFDGRGDDERFRREGRKFADGDRALALRAMLATPEGTQHLRSALEAQKPENATETQWKRAVTGVLDGMREAIAGTEREGKLQQGITVEQNQRALIYLRANQFSPAAYEQVRSVFAQPAQIRERATRLLLELPDFERTNLFSLFAKTVTPAAEASDEEWNLFFTRSEFQDAPEDQQRAIFDALANDGFSRALSSETVTRLFTAAHRAGDLEPSMRQDYLDLIPRIGLDRLQLVTDDTYGLVAQMNPEVFDRFQKHLGATHDLEALLAGSAVELELSAPRIAPITEDGEPRAVLGALELRNVTLELDGQPIDVARYFEDSAYRSAILSDLAGEPSCTRHTLERVRGRFDTMLRNLAASLREEGSARKNLAVDVSGGSELHTLFGLSGERGVSPEHQFARREILAAWNTVTATLPTKNGGSQTLDSVALAAVLGSADPAAELEALYPGLDLEETVAAFSRLLSLGAQGKLPGQDPELIGPLAEVDLTKRSGSFMLDRLAARLKDSEQGNVRCAVGLKTVVRSRAEFSPSNPSVLLTDAKLNAVAGNNWFQYGIDHPKDRGAYASIWVHDRAKDAYLAAGKKTDPSHPIHALFDLENYRKRHRDIGQLELGLAHGRALDVLVDPVSGLAAQPEDFQVLSFVGRGIGDAGRRDAKRMTEMFVTFGGVPDDQVETHVNPTRQEMYDAIRAEIARDPRESGSLSARTVVVHYAGHTTSGHDNSVLGFSLRDGRFSPDQIRELNMLAQQQGVNMLWCTDACRAGEFVANAGDLDLETRRAGAIISTAVEHLAGLRQGVMEQHRSLSEIRNDRSHEPSWRELAELGARAMRDGVISPELSQMRELDAATASYVSAVETTIAHRDALATEEGVDPDLLASPFLRGEREWDAGRKFSSFVLGDLADRIAKELGARM